MLSGFLESIFLKAADQTKGWWLSSSVTDFTYQVSWVQLQVTAGLFIFVYFTSQHLKSLEKHVATSDYGMSENCV